MPDKLIRSTIRKYPWRVVIFQIWPVYIKKLKSRDRKTKTRRIRSEKEKGRNSKIEYPRLRLSNRGIVIRLVNTVALPVIARVIASGGKLAREWSGALLRLRKYMWSTILISGARCSLCIDNPVFDIFGRESAKIMPPRGRNIWRPTYHRGTSDSVECIVIYRTCHTASSSMLSRNNGEEEYFRPSKYRSSGGDVKFF